MSVERIDGATGLVMPLPGDEPPPLRMALKVDVEPPFDPCGNGGGTVPRWKSLDR